MIKKKVEKSNWNTSFEFKLEVAKNFDKQFEVAKTIEMVAIECWKIGLILGKILPIKGSSHLRAWHPKSQRKNPSFGEKLRERNILKHVVILKEHLAPQYGYYEFTLLRDISQDYVFGAWVRENYFWEWL